MSAVERLNLASKPFANRSPRRRLRILLWTLAALLMVLNAFLFAQYWISSSSSRQELRTVRERSDRQVEAMRELQRRLAAVDLETQNEQVRFLNRKIAERTFPWSDLFDDLAAVLPRNVRLLNIAPAIEESAKSRRGEEIATSIDWIGLEVKARAKSSDDVLDFIDAMFEHPSFAGPTLAQEALSDGEVQFDASVRYRVAPVIEPEPAEGSSDLLISSDESGRNGEAASGPEVAQGAPESAAPTSGSALVDGVLEGQTRSGDVSRARVAGQSSARRNSATEVAAEGAAQPAAELTASSTVRPSPPALRSSSRPPTRTSTGRDPASRSAGVPAATGNVRRTGAGTSNRGDGVPEAVPGSADEIADERFGRGQPVAPRVRNASGGGAR